MKFLPIFALAAAAFVSSCSTSDQTGPTTFDGVRYYHLDLEKETMATPDPMVRFEEQHYLHGAISKEDRDARQGHYYTMWWNTEDRTTPATVRFQYRQLATGAQIHVIEVPIGRISKRNKTKINVTGEPYQTNGRVTSWRATIVRNGQEVAEEKSYLWN